MSTLVIVAYHGEFSTIFRNYISNILILEEVKNLEIKFIIIRM